MDAAPFLPLTGCGGCSSSSSSSVRQWIVIRGRNRNPAAAFVCLENGACFTLLHHHHHHHHRVTTMMPRVCFSRKRRPWDSNAEEEAGRKWMFDFGEEGKNDAAAEDEEMKNKSFSGILDQVTDNLFIFKVLRSYGWFLPFILISLFLESGPKAFLLTLGLATGLSFIAYALQKLLNLTPSRPGRKFKRKKNSSTTMRSNFYAKSDKSSQTRKEGNSGSSVGGSDNSVGSDFQGKTTFGGWDELDEVDYMAVPVKIPNETKVEPSIATDHLAKELVKMPDQKKAESDSNRLSRSWRDTSRTPLLLRMLIAAFPFLSSWMKLY